MPDDAKDVRVAEGPGSSSTAPNTRNIHQRLHAVMKDVSYVQKDRDVGKYKVVSHDAVTAAVRPVLVKHGVIYYPQNMIHTQDGNRTEVHLDIVFANVDDPKDCIAVPTFGYGIDPSDKGPGKAVSYAVKMALLKALGLETGEDADDGTDAKHEPAPKAEPDGPKVEQLSKGEARPEYTALVKEMQQQQDPAALAAWGATNKARMLAMPADWQDHLRHEYSEHKRSLEKRTAA